ncbi:DEAD/DEAH box helicase family protein [Leptolyngbya sp. 15MV]|nr:DEAD/DEAH box helicase family protein [Leptolyngbya sp. 15MV]
MTISLRPYQRAAIDALYDYFAGNTGNPLVVMPTGTGKSVCIAGFIREAIAAYADTRVLVLTHVRELIQQNFQALLRAWPDAPAGIYSAGLSRRDIRAQILFAGIQSIHRHAFQVQRCDLVLIDEAHLLGRGDSGMYRSFLKQLDEVNAGLLKVVGFTATPYRLDSGLLHEGKDRLFTDIAYDVPVLDMIQQGYLSPVVPKQTETQLDVGGVGSRGGEFIAKDLEAAVDRDEVTRAAVAEIVQHGAGRGSWLEDAWARRLALDDISPALRTLLACGPVILITGHVGNWELLGTTLALLGFPMHALYRPLDLPPLDRYVRQTRRRQGLEVVDKFGALRQLPELVASGAPIGMVADQNAGDRGLFVPFFGRLASSYKSIGLLAMQFNATVVCGFARRLEPDDPEAARSGGLAYRMELVDRFGPGDWSTHPDPLFYLTARWRRAVETMVRRAPEQYLWMHRVWRSRPRHERLGRPFPPALLDKLRALPWMTADGLDRLVDRSARDARLLAETGQDKLS